MTHETMSVHQALAELKTMDARIGKAIIDGKFCACKRHIDKKIDGVPVGEYCEKTIRSSFDSANGLIHRRNAIKRAVVKSNAVTEVVIDGTTYTVAEAIEMHNNGISHFQDLLLTMQTQYETALRRIAANSGEAIQKKGEEFVTNLYGGKDKVDGNEVKKQVDQYVEANSFELVDPLDIQKEMAGLEKFISEFSTKVDAALSVSNALTVIEIDY